MSFSYVTSTSATERDYIRFIIRDTVENSGPLPNGGNFTNEELDMMLGVEGTWQRAVAACYEALHSAWVDHVTFQADGMALSLSHIPKGYEAKAAQQRKLYGGGAGTGHVYAVTRVDGYSQDVPSTQVDDVTY